MKINLLTSSEEALMKVIWRLENAYMKDIIDAYPEPKPHQNTISTYLNILIKKGFLNAKKEGRINKYSVSIHYDIYKNEVINEIINNYFEGYGTELVSFLIKKKFVKTDDVKNILQSEGITLEPTEEKKISEYLSNLINDSISQEKKVKKKKKKKKKNK